MQMAKTSAALQRMSRRACLYLGDDRSDDGRCSASFAMLGDINIGEPGH